MKDLIGGGALFWPPNFDFTLEKDCQKLSENYVHQKARMTDLFP